MSERFEADCWGRHSEGTQVYYHKEYGHVKTNCEGLSTAGGLTRGITKKSAARGPYTRNQEKPIVRSSKVRAGWGRS
jgi:hypothetical protein